MSVSQANPATHVTEQGSNVTISPYGSWKSPVLSSMVSQSSLFRTNLHIDAHPDRSDTVYWVEVRSDEGGRFVVCSNSPSETTVRSWTPRSYNACSRVHEYGGGAFFVYDGSVYFSNFTDQRMYMQTTPDDQPVAITPDKQWRYADGQFSHKTGLIYCVREDHDGIDNLQNAVNSVIVINPRTKEQTVLVEGADFYSHPRASPDGRKLCWIQWDHPNMPWDCTELWVADLNTTGHGFVEGSPKKVVSGVSVIMPSFDSNNELLYVSDKTDWWNLYHVTKSGEHVNLLPRQEEIGNPHWQFGNEVYAADPRGGDTILTLSGGKLGVVHRSSGEYRMIETGYTSHSNIHYSRDGSAYCDAGSHDKVPAVIKIDVATERVDVLRESLIPHIHPSYLSVPRQVSWPTNETEVSYGYFYPPINKDFAAPAGSLPPLLVKAHGGPTACADQRLSYKTQYFTSRGFAVLDVNYRGSTGYGRKYRDRLRHKWGVYDIEDCCTGAKYLADSGLVHPDKLCMSGGSAGGYSTLACLAFHDIIKAGVSSYGICDVGVLCDECHKFECRYVDLLIASNSTPEGQQIIKDRSPIFHLDKFNHPVAFFHGTDDKVVPPNQAEMMHKAVKDKQLPTFICLFKGEGHGFKKAENIHTALDGEFYFFSRIFDFIPADKDIVKIHIDNLD